MTGTLMHKNYSNLNERWMKVEQNEQQKLVSKVPLHWMDVLNVGWISLQSRWKVAFRGRDSLITSFQPTHPSQPSPTYHQCQKSFTITSPSDVSLPHHLPRATFGISLFFLKVKMGQMRGWKQALGGGRTSANKTDLGQQRYLFIFDSVLYIW